MFSTDVKCSHCGRTVHRDVVVYDNYDRKYCSLECADRQVDLDIGVGHHTAAQSTSSRGGGDDAAARDRSPPLTTKEGHR